MGRTSFEIELWVARNAVLTSAFLVGIAVGFSLIFAIGAQNAFVLRQGLLGEHVWVVALVCACADALLIAVGVAGLSFLLIDALDSISRWLFAGAALWLLGYGVLRLLSAINGYSISSGDSVSGGLMATLSIAAALTFANPHVYLDTVVLIGTISLQFCGVAKLAYAVGTTTASFLFFSHWRLARGCWPDEYSDPVQGECLTVRLRY